MPAVLIRAPRPDEFAVCRALLPDAFREPGREFRIAALDREPWIGGAASYIRTAAATGELRISVPPALRRSGIGSTLLAAVVEQARGHGHLEISGWLDASQEWDGASFAGRHGFTLVERWTSARTPLRPLLDYLGALPRPAAGGCRIEPLSSNLRTGVAALWKATLGSGLSTRSETVEAHLRNGHYDGSPVAVRSGEVIGFVLLSVEGAGVRLAAEAIAPAYRAGPVFLQLAHAAADLVRPLPDAHVQFEWGLDAVQTPRIFRRFALEIMSIRERHVLRLV